MSNDIAQSAQMGSPQQPNQPLPKKPLAMNEELDPQEMASSLIKEKQNEMAPLMQELDFAIGDLDVKLNRVLKKHEHDYLKGYSLYVKQKEKELRDLVLKLNDQNNQANAKDTVIAEQILAVKKLTAEVHSLEDEKEKLKGHIKYHKQRASAFESDKNFLQQQIAESKRQNKLLKLALGRLQEDADNKEKIIRQAGLGQTNANGFDGTFMTSVLGNNKGQQDQTVMGSETKATDQTITIDTALQTKTLEIETNQNQTNDVRALVSSADQGMNSPDNAFKFGQSLLDSNNAHNETIAGTSFFDSKMFSSQRAANNFPVNTGRAISQTPQSRLRVIPTRNLKFERFIDTIFKTRMPNVDLKDEVVKYVQALETSYTDAIKELKIAIDRETQLRRKATSDRTAYVADRSEIEQLFVSCVEEVRKEVMKRRLKTELYNKKKFQSFDRSSEEAREFEESLLRLAQLSKKKVKIEDFTNLDRYHLLDLFVNNERTLLKIYEALFPHRVQQNSAGEAGTRLGGAQTATTYGKVSISEQQRAESSGDGGYRDVSARGAPTTAQTVPAHGFASSGAPGRRNRPSAVGLRSQLHSVDIEASQRITMANTHMLDAMQGNVAGAGTVGFGETFTTAPPLTSHMQVQQQMPVSAGAVKSGRGLPQLTK